MTLRHVTSIHHVMVTLYGNVFPPPFLLISRSFSSFLLSFLNLTSLAFEFCSLSPSTMASLTDYVDFSQSSLKGASDIMRELKHVILTDTFAVVAVSIAFNPIFWK